MVDLHTILADHKSKYHKEGRPGEAENIPANTTTLSEIPDLFFDEILVAFKLNRIEIMVLMYLYRRVWCRPNLYRLHGISQLLSHTEMSKALNLSLDEIYHALRKLEEFAFITTVRSGQYFVRRFFTKENDELLGQNYDDFEI
ncbi:MAG: hypothetical protein A2504_08315 [Bdellovibrionales bacterium RIFOXYD12_FULL_39_22]|nr:MAG: hypothetical protein A2385_01540 [Bdellovibrionales bacterium RIFOXYB1_FULL_39_21]OFZ42872.1 MAG: hypothetical protein A2485_10830 [Bdellovibrionales bacterium RIFOXYC12_FULL_39_17]OFZ47468.1 MAG: hypothetical protein A2404_14460 [Bdellovibrionales bacterium RIFOXYC1_FULL_39_130]OFZ75556.1 MAG: hypothetical protein A2560_14610 [Bdellovibrionales bacterium RIFOXYD1_FULL_39_84]OFZ93879.1 MAG: hypothetical protein A2504_08315 [Bdellovibrionales bacterium RIFOXYD12_FULL_39_22]HLE10115.1 hy